MSARPFGDTGFGEPEMDANTALTDLDKGLRSAKIGEQCEAIVRFPALFERYPFPILINSAFLKLADVFRIGTNFLRFWVLRVCQQCERHLEKIVSVDEFVRRIFSVIHANDPIARSLTLRTLGSLAGLISERKPIHHSIRVALDSHDRVEVSAAIYAAACFARRSKTFGTTMCTKISSMVQRLSTPMDLKLRLVSIFQYMHHDVTTASMVRKLCEELLTFYPSKEFVITTLSALTQLAAATKSDMGQQVSLLLSNLEDTRPHVKLSILKNLKFLAEDSGHLWESGHISSLLNFISRNISSDDRMETDEEPESSNPKLEAEIVYTSLDVISCLTKFSATFTSQHSDDVKLLQLIDGCIKSRDVIMVLKAIDIGTNIAVNCKENNVLFAKISEMTQSGLESLVVALCRPNAVEHLSEESQVKDLKQCLKCGISMCKARPSQLNWFLPILIRLMMNDDLSETTMCTLSEALGAIGGFGQMVVQEYLGNLIDILDIWSRKLSANETNNTVAVLLAVILQVHEGFSINEDISRSIQNVIERSNSWMAYKIARNGFRYGQPIIARKALEGRPSTVSSENLHFWLSGLEALATGESMLQNSDAPNILDRLSDASNMYHRGVTSLRAASSNTMNLAFQIEYAKIRADMLVAFKTFLVSCGGIRFHPPPAIAPNIAIANRDDLLRAGRVVTQLRKSIREFQNLGEMYGRLYQTAFDADNASLVNIQTLQQMCLLVVRAIEKVAVSKEHPSFSSSDQAFEFCIQDEATTSPSLIRSCNLAVKMLGELKQLKSQSVEKEHMECLKQSIRVLVETPITYPRFFFQTLQNTRAKIAVSPQPRVAGESVVVSYGNNLALKVEGVIEQRAGKSRGGSDALVKAFRKPKAIRVTVVAVPTSTPRAHELSKQMNSDSVTLVEEVKPHKDFFTAQFLLNGWTHGLTNVTIDTALVDYEGRLWITGPRATLSIRVYEDSGSKNVPSGPSSSGASASGSIRAPPSGGQNTQQYAPGRF